VVQDVGCVAVLSRLGCLMVVVWDLGRVTVVVRDLGRLVDYQGTQGQAVFQLIDRNGSE